MFVWAVLLSLVSALTVNVDATEVLSLTPKNYDSATRNKIVFLKFYAPWCSHCQELKPSWEKLAADYADSDTFLVAEVDCTTPETESWCQNVFDIEGFPTLLFGDPARDGVFLEEYEDDRDYETLADFAEEMFATPLCNIDHLDGCPAESKEKLQHYMRMSSAEIDAELERIENEMEEMAALTSAKVPTKAALLAEV